MHNYKISYKIEECTYVNNKYERRREKKNRKAPTSRIIILYFVFLLVFISIDLLK